MIIMMFSLFGGSIGWWLGYLTDIVFWQIVLALVGFFLPPFYALEKIYFELTEKNKC